jgi:hypothetical protein
MEITGKLGYCIEAVSLSPLELRARKSVDLDRRSEFKLQLVFGLAKASPIFTPRTATAYHSTARCHP